MIREEMKSVRDGIEDFMCPFTDMYITQGSNGLYSHQGTMANDVRGKNVGERYLIFAPCDIICKKLYPETGQAMFQSLKPVRFANSRIDYATFMVAHDNTMDCFVGQTFKQGESFFQMGDKGFATGVHTHIQISQSKCMDWYKNEYGIYKFNYEYDTDECYFIDYTNIINGMGGNWKHLSDVPVMEEKIINIPAWIEERNVYNPENLEIVGTLKPMKFGGLSYKIIKIDDNMALIDTLNFRRCYVKITEATPITNTPMYENGNY